VNGQLYTPATLPPYLLDRRLGRPQNWFGHGSKEKKIPAPAGNQTPVIQSRNQLTICWRYCSSYMPSIHCI